MRKTTAGFTLFEVIISMAIAGLILGFIAQIFGGTIRIQARESQNIPVQQDLRASLEIMAQEFRAAVGPRVVYTNVNGTSPLPSGLSVSDGTSFTLLVPVPNSTFLVSPPVGYPAVTSLPPRTTTGITNTTLADTATASRTCSDVFAGRDYAVYYNTVTTSLPSATARNPDASRIIQTDTLPCVGGGASAVVSHSGTPLPTDLYTANSYVVKVNPITYNIVNNILYRTVYSAGVGTPQVVSYNISALTVQYLPENTSAGLANCSPPATYTSTPSCTPRSVILTVTSIPQNSGVAGAQALTASQTVFLR